MNSKAISKVTATVVALVLLFLSSLIFVTNHLISSSRDASLAEVDAEVTRFATGAEVAINRSLLGIDVMLAGMDRLLNLSNLQPNELNIDSINRLLQVTVRQNLLIRHVALLDLKGHVLASSDPSGSELTLNLPVGFVDETFSNPVSTMAFSTPTISLISSEQVVYFARHVYLADHSKVLMVAEVQLPLLTSILIQGVDINGLEVTLERANGQLFASHPAQDIATGGVLSPPLGDLKNLDSTATTHTRLSQLPAIVKVRPTLYSDVLISASVPLDAALKNWTLERSTYLKVASAFALMIMLAGGFAIWYFDRLAKTKRAMSESKRMLDQALESMVSGFLLLNANYQIVSWNQRFVALYPWCSHLMTPLMPFQKILETSAQQYFPDANETVRQDWVNARMAQLALAQGTHEQNSLHGKVIKITERQTPEGGVVVVYEDVTELRQAAAEVEKMAFFDPLTELPNRRLLVDRMQQAIIASARSKRQCALLFLDLDHFKVLNDTLGHEMGDLLLKEVAQRLRVCVREEDTVARLGGDEFVIMLQGLSPHKIEAAAQTQIIGEKIQEYMSLPFLLGSHSHTITTSMGATFFGIDKQSPEDLLKEADIAMYQVKTNGRNALCFFDPAMLDAINKRAALEKDLRLALGTDQLLLHFQVQVAYDGSAVGAEALIRWHHPERGMVMPGEFITLAEETALIVPMGLWVLQSACKLLADWRQKTDRDLIQLAVNVSARQFRQPDFVEQVKNVLLSTGANPSRLKLELTESLVLDNVKDAIEKMKALKAIGVRFSMDDFGTGHSSLTYLTQLPLDQLKIDQSFVRNIGVKETDSVIIDTIIGMANNLGLEVIAEGVETTEQRDFLEQHGCHLFQGYLYSKPVALPALESLLAKLALTSKSQNL